MMLKYAKHSLTVNLPALRISSAFWAALVLVPWEHLKRSKFSIYKTSRRIILARINHQGTTHIPLPPSLNSWALQQQNVNLSADRTSYSSGGCRKHAQLKNAMNINCGPLSCVIKLSQHPHHMETNSRALS